MASVTICSDFGAPKNKVCHCFHCFPFYLPWSGGTELNIPLYICITFSLSIPLHLWGRNRGADIENRSVGTIREGEGGMNWESSTAVHTLPCVWNRQLARSCCIAQGAQLGALWWPRRWDAGGRSQREGIYVHTSLIHFVFQQKLTQLWKAIMLQCKKVKCNELKK